jgi:hypothetical protein
MADKRQATVAYAAHMTPEEDVLIRKYGEQLLSQKHIEKNTKYAITKFLLDQVVSVMRQSFVPGEVTVKQPPAAPESAPKAPSV